MSRRSDGRKRRVGDARKDSVRGVRLGPREWVDDIIGVLGTRPEKMVMAEMLKREIPFSFQHYMGDVWFTEEKENWRVDFYIPSSKIVIEVNGDYWHTLGDRPFQDAYRYAVMEELGYKVLVWWESDILAKMWELFEAEPLLKNPPVKGPPVGWGPNIDDLKASRRMALMRRKGSAPTAKRSQRRRVRNVRG